MTIGQQPSPMYNIILIGGFALIIATIIWGVTGYDSRREVKRLDSYTSDVREWCKSQKGIAMYKGDTYSWDCILIEN